jgi:TolB-like protein
MRINVQFENPATTQILWSDTYERDVQNVLQAQSDIVNRIAAAVDTVLTAGGKTTKTGVSG